MIGAENVPAGRLWSHRRRTESASFAYLDTYLARADAYELDPALPLTTGQFQTPPGFLLFGAFADSAPDRWGRRLIARGESHRAREQGVAERSFAEIDYLLGVRDDLRQGSIRFRELGSGHYLATQAGGVPAFRDLPALLEQAEAIERGDERSAADVEDLLRAGSSLGGARPKAHVRRRDGTVAIAKFPSPATDDWDVIRWEAVALELARESGIGVPAFTLESVAERSVLVVDRFDRRGETRIAYASAMTMLEAGDRDQRSYLDIADVIERQAADAEGELRQLWRRIAFNVLISNTDDHLRNHGFLRSTTSGWSLSPAFDLNPDPSPGTKRLRTTIDTGDDAADLGILMDVSGFFRLDAAAARATLAEVLTATARWERAAEQVNLTAAERASMSSAFVNEQRRRADELVARQG